MATKEHIKICFENPVTYPCLVQVARGDKNRPGCRARPSKESTRDDTSVRNPQPRGL